MRFCSLGSGSSGNATLVEHYETGIATRVLLDCGLPLKHLAERLAHKGLTMVDIDAVFITHEHSDHVGSVQQFVAQHPVPIWMSRGTYHSIGRPRIGPSLNFAQCGDAIAIGSLSLHPFIVPHDAKEPLQVIVASGTHKLGLLTDLGHVSRHVVNQLSNLDALILECNHDPESLRSSKYPAFLKQRISGDYGHLSNEQAATCLALIAHAGLRHVVAAHLSEQNNHADWVRRDLDRAMRPWHPSMHLTIANAEAGFEWIELSTSH